MLIYFALIIPIISCFIIYQITRGKLLIGLMLVYPFIFSLIVVFFMKFIIEKAQVTSKEYWGSIVKRVEYYEDWNEWITQTCTTSCCCDKDGNNCQTTTYDCSYSRYHPAEYKIVTTTDEVISIDKDEYKKIVSKFGNENKIDLGRDYYTIDGDEYYGTWNGDTSTAIPVTTLHHYENRVKAADQSVFHFEPVKKEDVKKYQLFEYPKVSNYYEMKGVLGDNTLDASLADKKIQLLNGFLGSKKQVKAFVLVFKNQPIDAAFYQKYYWAGGNKNEFIVCVGIDNSRQVKWCKVISWTKAELLKTEVENFVQSQSTLNLQQVADFMTKELDAKFVRMQFKEFDYLTVEPPLGAVLLTYLLVVLANIYAGYLCTKNRY